MILTWAALAPTIAGVDRNAGVAVELTRGRIAGERLEGSEPRRLDPVVGSIVTVFAVAITAGVTATGAHATTGASSGGAALAALGRAVVVGVPLAAAVYASQRRVDARSARQLFVVGGILFVASLSSSSSALLYSIGRVAGWAATVAAVYLMLASPEGRLVARIDRVLLASFVAGAGALFVSTVPFVGDYPSPSPWSSCSVHCPHNVFMAVSSEPRFISNVVVDLQAVFFVCFFVAVVVRLRAKTREAGALRHGALAPMRIAAIALIVTFASLAVARKADPASWAAVAAGWLVAFAIVSLGVAFLVGAIRWHLFVTAGVRKVNAALRGMPGPAEVRDLLASAFDDPGLEIASWSGRRRRWIAMSGRPLVQPPGGSGRHLTEVREGRRRVVAIVHDAALAEDTAFVEAAAAAASVAFAGDRVAAHTSGLVRELKALRSRLVAAGDSERRRIERDLHDGAQQHLVALSIQLELAAEQAEAADPAEAGAMREMAGEAEHALQELRTLTRGMCPATLVERGLEVALRSAAGRCPVPTTVDASGIRGYPDEITTAVYFCCLEALQNVAKHARGARSAHIELRDADSVLSFLVSDDGPGINDRDARVGAGMINMRDRMTTVGGKLTVRSRPGQGTRVSGRIALTALPSADTPPGHGLAGTVPGARQRGHAERSSGPRG